MKTRFSLLVIFLLAIGGSASAQLVLPICSVNLPCPGFPLGSVQAPIDQNGWRNFKVTLTSNVTSFSFVGIPPTPAQAAVNIIFTQDATGGRTVTFAAGITSPCTVTSTANATTLCQFEYDGTAGAWIGIGGSASGAANATSFYLSKSCAGLTNCAQIFGDTQTISDATSNSTTTVVCPNNDCNFVAGDVGKTFWATTQGTGTGGTNNNTTFVCPLTTIATVNSAQSITLNLACTASGTANVVIIWGHRDGAALHALDGNNVGCLTMVPFSGAAMMIDQAIFLTPPTCLAVGLQPATGYPQKDWIPAGNSAILILTPDFNYSTCTGGSNTNVCIGIGLNELDNTGIWGTGLTPASNANCANANGKVILQLNSTNAALKNTNVSGICPGQGGSGVVLATTDEQWIGGGAQYAMTNPCEIKGSAVWTAILDCRADAISGVFGMTVDNNATVTDMSTFVIVGLQVLSGGTYSSRGTHFISNSSGNVDCVSVASGGTWYSYGDYLGIDSGTNGSCLDINGIAQLANTKIAGTAGGVRAIGMGTGTMISLGGNTITAGPVTWFTGWSLSGTDILQGSCTGTVASASTIGLFNLGNNQTTTCTSTTTNLGPVMGKAGTLFGFGCNAGTAGNQAADACTVMKNNVATSLTCSLNGVTSCGDGAVAHQTTFAVGDIITVKVVSGTSTTLANVKASVIAW